MSTASKSNHALRLLPLAMGFLILLAQPASAQPAPGLEEKLQAAQTILLAGQARTWMDLPHPPYNAAITVKTKLERAGFRVALDRSQPHQHVLVMTYLEAEGREYGKLQRGTNITCELTIWRVTPGAPQKLWTRTIESSTSWPVPIGSPYWDAVQNLEENPYYYYIGELAQGLTASQEDAGAVFARALRQKKLGGSTYESGGGQASGHVVANAEARLNAIRELGRLKDRRALPTLWDLAATKDEHETSQRDTALKAIGDIGDPDSLDRLNALYNAETDEGLKAVLDKAITRIMEQNQSEGGSK
jgi:hypothetical protein